MREVTELPWTPAQHRLFEAAAHNPAIAASHGMSPQKAAGMAVEGIKSPGAMPAARRAAMVQALRKRG